MTIKPMTKRALTSVALILLLAGYASAADTPAPKPRPDVARELLQMANDEREQRGIAALSWDDHLAESALAHAVLVADHHSLDHRFPGELGLMQRIAAAGAHFNAVAENLAFAESTEDIHSGLMASPGHRRNILNPDYDALGIAVLQVGERLYAVQNFAHLSPEVTPSQAERMLADRFNKLRRKSGLLPVRFEPDTGIRESVCGMAAHDQISAAALPRVEGARNLVAFTASDPADLPDRLKPAITSPTIAAIRIGACYKETPNYPGGIYWFGVVY